MQRNMMPSVSLGGHRSTFASARRIWTSRLPPRVRSQTIARWTFRRRAAWES